MRDELEKTSIASHKFSAVNKLVQQLREYIIKQGLKTGQKLPSEREIGELYCCARNTVREAFVILRAYGVVEIRPKIGAIIANQHIPAALNLLSFQLDIAENEFTDIQNFRRLVEIGSYDQIIKRISTDDITKLRAINDPLKTNLTYDELANIDFQFHYNLLKISGNKTVLGIYNTIGPIVKKLMINEKINHTRDYPYEEHKQIIDSLEKLDRIGFKFHMTNHLDCETN